MELPLPRPSARHSPAHTGPVSRVSTQQGRHPGGSEPQESHPERGRCEARGDVEDVGAVPRLQAGPADQGGVTPADHGARL